MEGPRHRGGWCRQRGLRRRSWASRFPGPARRPPIPVPPGCD